MTTRAQDATIDRLALKHGRVAVRDGYQDGHVVVTAPSGSCWKLSEDGVPTPDGYNISINWNE